MKQTNWKPGINYDSVHCIGNGKVYAYGRGPEIFDMGGPYYSTPNFIAMELDPSVRNEISSVGKREPGAAVWTHTLYKNNADAGVITDYTAAGSPVYIRDILGGANISWVIRNIREGGTELLNDAFMPEADYIFISSLPPGTFFYNDYPVIDALTSVIAIKGDANIRHNGGSKLYLEKTSGGNCRIYFAFGENEAYAIKNCADALKNNNILSECREYWNDFTSERLKNRPIAAASEHAAEIAEAADDAAVLIKCQQGDDGGILAGYNYHLSYVRDNYGTFRGLLATGCYSEAKKLVQYYAKVYDSYGKIHNAQGIGCRAFHVHENDKTEITGYAVLMGMEYLAATGDEKTVRDMLPLIKYCMDAQQKELSGGALSFNGDETYVAGGIIPRSALIDGSMEATLLYYKAGELLLPWLEKNKLAEPDWIRTQKDSMKEIKDNFANNFIENGILYCNKPNYYTYETAPFWRNGVRECGHGFGCSFKTENLRYVCRECYGKNELEKSKPVKYELISAGLMPAWINIGCDIVPKEITDRMLAKIATNWKSKKILPSRPEGGNTVGYDYGLAIFSLLKSDRDAAEELINAALDIRDETGAWVEYYSNGTPMGTKCRPWESGVNIAALLSVY